MRYVKPRITAVSDASSEIKGDPTQKQPGNIDSPLAESPVAAYSGDE
jgi:hypothetical protein